MAQNARAEALLTLNKIFRGGQYSNIALDSAIKSSGLEGAERALCTRLVYGVIERKITLDYYIDALSSTSPEKIELYVRNILRMGLYQIIYMDKIPDHAATDASVELAKKSSKGFVNAILRSYLRGRDKLTLPKKEVDVIKYLSVKYSFGEPICRDLCAHYGEERTESILSAFCSAGRMSLRTNTLKSDRESLISSLISHGADASKGVLESEICVRDLSLSACPEFASGDFFVQDRASQICVAVLGAKSGEKIIDMCSAPGSKSFGAAIDMKNCGEILAYDIHENKLSLIERSAKRLGIGIIETAMRDGRQRYPESVESADRVICDVPCSGFGVVAKKPELRYKDPAESSRLPEIQYEILSRAAEYLKVGGTLVYSTCTILPEENENIIERFLGEHKNFKTDKFCVGGVDAPQGYVTLLPDVNDCDGFFICRLIKTDKE